MKKFSIISTLVLGLGILLTGCNKDDKSDNGPVLGLNPSSDIEFPAEGASMSVAVTSNVDWTVASNKSWCKVSKGDGKFTVTAGPSESVTAPKPATITVTAGTGLNVIEKTITATQIGLTQAELSIAPSTPIAFDPDGGSKTITVTTNQADWTVVSDQDWCKVAMAQTGGKFTISADANTSNNVMPPAVVTVTAGTGNAAAKKTIDVTQGANMLKPAVSEVAIPAVGGGVKVAVEHSKPFTASVPTGSWVTAKVEGDNVIITAKEFYDAAGRDEIVTLTSGGLTAPIAVSQKKVGYDGYIGEWTMTGVSSMDDSETITYSLSIQAKEVGKTYSVTGWSGSGIDADFPMVMKYLEGQDAIAAMGFQDLGNVEIQGTTYGVMPLGMAYIGDGYYMITSTQEYIALGGFMAANRVEWVGQKLDIGDGKTYYYSGISYCLRKPDGKFTGLEADEAFPVDPVMVKGSASGAKRFKAPMKLEPVKNNVRTFTAAPAAMQALNF